MSFRFWPKLRVTVSGVKCAASCVLCTVCACVSVCVSPPLRSRCVVVRVCVGVPLGDRVVRRLDEHLSVVWPESVMETRPRSWPRPREPFELSFSFWCLPKNEISFCSLPRGNVPLSSPSFPSEDGRTTSGTTGTWPRATSLVCRLVRNLGQQWIFDPKLLVSKANLLKRR